MPTARQNQIIIVGVVFFYSFGERQAHGHSEQASADLGVRIRTLLVVAERLADALEWKVLDLIRCRAAVCGR